AFYYGYASARAMPRFPSLNRGSKDGVILKDATGRTIDSLAYVPGPRGDGVSIERVSPTTGSDVPENWQPSAATRGATPGAENTAQAPSSKGGVQNHHIKGRKTLRIKFRSSMSRTNMDHLQSTAPIEHWAM